MLTERNAYGDDFDTSQFILEPLLQTKRAFDEPAPACSSWAAPAGEKDRNNQMSM